MSEPQAAAVGASVEPGDGEATGGEKGEAHDQLTELPIMRPYVSNKSFPVACGCHCFLFFLFVILNVAMSTKFLNFSVDVALHLWDNKWLIRSQAVTEGLKIATYDFRNASTAQELQTQASIPAGAETYEIRVVYNANDGNMLTLDKLAKVKALEDTIVNHADYSKYCLRLSGSTECKLATSVVNSCNPNLCGYVQNTAGIAGPQTGCGAFNTAGNTPASDCTPGKSYPTGVYDCKEADGCTRDQWEISESFLNTKVSHYSQSIYQVDSPETIFLLSADSGFGSGSSTTSALMSGFTFGFPIEGYSNVDDRPEEQSQKVADFMADAYFDLLDNYNSDHDDGILIGYYGGDLPDASLNKLLASDFAFVGLAFVVVWIYVVFMTESIFYATMAMGQIFMCFTSGFLVYFVIFGSFFGTFHIMAIFLLVGVGVDDVFVFLDHYEAALQMNEQYVHNPLARLSWTWKSSAIAMGVTSGTTATAFFMNATSSFPGIASFGIFAGCLTIVNYISMLFYWPAVVTFNQYYFKNRKFCFGIFEKLFKKQEKGAGQTLAEGEGEVPKPALVRFFEHHFSYFIINFRIRILLVFLAASVFMFIQLGNLTVSRESPQMLPDDHPVYQYIKTVSTKFIRGGGDFSTVVRIVWGFDHTPIERDGIDTTGTGNGADLSTVGLLGDVRWNPNWYGTDGKNDWSLLQGSYECVIQICDAAEAANSDRNTGGLPAYEMTGCWVRELKAEASTTEWSNIIGGDHSSLMTVLGRLSAKDPTWYQSDVLDMSYFESLGNDELLYRFHMVELKLTSDLNIHYEDGNALGESWENFLGSQQSTGQCVGVADKNSAFVYALHFHQFKITETLMSEMVSGVGVSILVALVVLIAVTGNIIIGGFAALSIACIVLWVMAMIPLLGWELSMVECIVLVMVPGLSVDFTAHLAESYNNAKYDDREHRVIHALEHSGASIISGAISTLLAAGCLLLCKVIFFIKFGTMLILTVIFALLWSLFFFPSVMALIGPLGTVGDWHHYIHPVLHRINHHQKVLRVDATRKNADGTTVAATRKPAPTSLPPKPECTI